MGVGVELAFLTTDDSLIIEQVAGRLDKVHGLVDLTHEGGSEDDGAHVSAPITRAVMYETLATSIHNLHGSVLVGLLTG